MSANLIQGNFTTLLSSSVREDNGVTKGGLIDQNYDGKIELYGKKLFMNFREGIDIRNDGDFDPNTKKGMGHQWIERFAVSDWKISADERGILLEVDF